MVLMTPTTDNSPQSLIPIRTEILHPALDWPETWRLARLKGLGSILTSFLFKLLHCLLPTQERVSRIGVAENLGLCLICNNEPEDLLHAFFLCQHSRVVGHALLGYLQQSVPDLTPEDVLKLQLGSSLSEDAELATVYTLATGLKYIWENRIEEKQLKLHKMRAEIEAWISISIRTQKLHGSHVLDVAVIT